MPTKLISASNQVWIGNPAVTKIGGFVDWAVLSDGRYKQNIKNDVPGLAFIAQLNPVTYTLDIDKIESKLHPRSDTNAVVAAAKDIAQTPVIYSGFIAQDVEKAAQSIGYNFSGVSMPANDNDVYGLRYAQFVVPLIKAVQEQQAMIEKQNKLIEALTQRLDKMEAKK